MDAGCADLAETVLVEPILAHKTLQHVASLVGLVVGSVADAEPAEKVVPRPLVAGVVGIGRVLVGVQPARA